MAEKSFGVKEVNLIGASGTPSITSPNNLNLNAVNVAISTNVSIGGTLSVTGNVSVGGTLTYEDVTNIDSVGIVTAREGIFIPDSKKLELGNASGSGDLKLYHDGTNSYLDNSTGITFIRNTGTNGSQIQLLNSNSGLKLQGLAGEQSIVALANGPVELYYDNVKRLETTSSGATVTGTVTSDGFIGNATKITLTSSTTNSSLPVLFSTGVIGSSGADTLINSSKLTFNPSSGTLSATIFSGSGANLTNLPVADSDIQVVYTVTANGSSAYRFAGNGVVSTADDPDLYLIRGQKYRFINNSGGSHPFQIREASGGTAYSTGVTNNGASSGNIDFAPTFDSPAQLVYQCTSHGGMVGNIYLRDAAGNNTNVGVTTFSGAVNVTAAVTADDFRTDSSSSTLYLTSASDWRFRTTSGSEKIRITSSGNVGINSTTPSTRLNVVGTIQAYDSPTGFVLLTPTGSIELRRGAGGFIDFSTSVSEDYDCRIKQNSSNDLVFDTGGSGSASEKLRITSGGTLEIQRGSSTNQAIDP